MSSKKIFKKWIDYFRENKGDNTVPPNNPDIDLWEEDYLVKKIQTQYSNVPEETIRAAVKSCYLIFRTPQSGGKLVQCVIDKLKDSETEGKNTG